MFVSLASIHFHSPREWPRIRWRFAAAHFSSLALFVILAGILYGSAPSHPDLLAAIWLTAGLAAILFGAVAIIPVTVWIALAKGAGYLWLVALAAAFLAAFGGNLMRGLWPRAAALTLLIVQFLLKPFGVFRADPLTATISGSRFSGEIAEQCSGLEGIGLILSFTTAWLVLFRRECRFPQALVLLPAGTIIIFLMNSVRIAALMLIGNAGYEAIAVGGFHSQAGWIIFNLVALGVCFAAGKVSWISNRPPATTKEPNPVAPWVMPFVAILAAGMIAHALSAGFEWLYPLRFIAAAATLWYYRESYRTLDWRIDWLGPTAGLAVGAMWLFLVQTNPLPTPAGATPPWITIRVLAAVVTVPIAEEFAFRAFLYRRFLNARFELASFFHFSFWALVASSASFGALHGKRWFAGTIAGVIFTLAMLRKGRLGNAIVAHGVANGMLAVAVLGFHRWDLW